MLVTDTKQLKTKKQQMKMSYDAFQAMIGLPKNRKQRQLAKKMERLNKKKNHG